MEKFLVSEQENQKIIQEAEVSPELETFVHELGKEKMVLLMSSFSKEAREKIKEYIGSGDAKTALEMLKNKKAELDGRSSDMLE